MVHCWADGSNSVKKCSAFTFRNHSSGGWFPTMWRTAVPPPSGTTHWVDGSQQCKELQCLHLQEPLTQWYVTLWRTTALSNNAVRPQISNQQMSIDSWQNITAVWNNADNMVAQPVNVKHHSCTNVPQILPDHNKVHTLWLYRICW
jgi:hypothetical protein